MEELKFATGNEALQYLADVTGKSIKVASYSLIDIFMNRDEMTKQEAEEYLDELKDRVADGESPEEILEEEGLEPDYILDLI